LLAYRFGNHGRYHRFEGKAKVEPLPELIGMPGHPLKFQGRLDGGETIELESLAGAQAQWKGDLVVPVGPPVHQDIGAKPTCQASGSIR